MTGQPFGWGQILFRGQARLPLPPPPENAGDGDKNLALNECYDCRRRAKARFLTLSLAFAHFRLCHFLWVCKQVKLGRNARFRAPIHVQKGLYTSLCFNSLFDLHLVVPFDDLLLALILLFSHNCSVHYAFSV